MRVQEATKRTKKNKKNTQNNNQKTKLDKRFLFLSRLSENKSAAHVNGTPLEYHQKNCFVNCALVSVDRMPPLFFIVDILNTKIKCEKKEENNNNTERKE